MRALTGLLLGFSALLILQGCGGSSSGYNGPWGQVTGTVQLDGKPIGEPASITFMSSETGFAALGEVDESGKFRLKYNGAKRYSSRNISCSS